MYRKIASCILAVLFYGLMASSAQAALVVISVAETWDGVSNPHAGDGVTLLSGVYTIPNGMTINAAGSINVGALNNNVTLSFAPAGGGLTLNGTINISSGIRTFAAADERTFMLAMNNNNITGTGDIVSTYIANSSQNRHNLSITGSGNVAFDDITLLHSDGGVGGNVNITVGGSVALDAINTSDDAGGGGAAENVTIRANSITVGAVSAFAVRPDGTAANGNLTLEALAPPTYSDANATGNTLANVLTLNGAVDLNASAANQAGGDLTLRAVRMTISSGFSLDQELDAVRTVQAGQVALGTPQSTLFQNSSAVSLTPSHTVQWAAPSLVIGTATEPFNTAASAAGNGWTSLNAGIAGNSFGFSNTNNTGATPAGEAGGVFARTGAIGYYADTTLGGNFARNNAFSASGELDITAISTSPAFDGGFGISFFDSTGTTVLGPGNFFDHVGLTFAEQSSTSLRALAQVQFSDGTVINGNILTLLGLNVDRTFNIDFDPMGGAFNLGQLEVTVSGPGGGTSFIDFTAAHAGKNFSLDAFGLYSQNHVSPNSGQTATAFIDNVTYSVITAAAVPEPAATLAWLIAFGVLAAVPLLRRR